MLYKTYKISIKGERPVMKKIIGAIFLVLSFSARRGANLVSKDDFYNNLLRQASEDEI
jgi:hypothetical protein